MTAPVPVLVITGPVGVGKSTIANEAAWLLRQADVPHALVDLDRIEQCWPVPADDPWNERVSHRNLEVFEQARVEDHLVDNENRPATVVAEEVLRRIGWLHDAAGQ